MKCKLSLESKKAYVYNSIDSPLLEKKMYKMTSYKIGDKKLEIAAFIGLHYLQNQDSLKCIKKLCKSDEFEELATNGKLTDEIKKEIKRILKIKYEKPTASPDDDDSNSPSSSNSDSDEEVKINKKQDKAKCKVVENTYGFSEGHYLWLVAILTLFKIEKDLDGDFSSECFKSVKKTLKIRMVETSNFQSGDVGSFIYSTSDSEFIVYFEKSLSIYNELPLARCNSFNQLISCLHSSIISTLTIMNFLYMFSPTISASEIRHLIEASQRPKTFYYQERIHNAEEPPTISHSAQIREQDTIWQNNIRGHTNYYPTTHSTASSITPTIIPLVNPQIISNNVPINPSTSHDCPAVTPQITSVRSRPYAK